MDYSPDYPTKKRRLCVKLIDVNNTVLGGITAFGVQIINGTSARNSNEVNEGIIVVIFFACDFIYAYYYI